MLKIKDLNINYGGINAVHDVSFEVEEGSIITLVGANGAGKSSILRSIAGVVTPKSGTIEFCGEDITGKSAEQVVKKGITLVPEGRRIFPDLTVLENIRIGAYLRKDNLEDDINWVYDLFPRLKERSWQMAGTLSGGEQQMLAMSRALMSSPKLLLLDEPSMGLSPLYVNIIFDMIKKVNEKGTTVLLVEQNAKKALSIANRAYVLEIGRMTKCGTGAELLNDEDIKKAYLGG